MRRLRVKQIVLLSLLGLVLFNADLFAQTAKPAAAKPATEQNADTADAQAQPEAEIVAIIHVSSNGLDKADADNLPMMLAKSVQAAGHRAMGPDQIDAFWETDSGRPLAKCLSIACVSEAGKLLGMTRVITGDVSKVKGMYRINLQLVSTSTSKAVASFRKTVPADKVNLSAELQTAVKALFAQAKPPQKPVAVAAVPESQADQESPEAKAAKEERFYKGNLTTIGPLEIIPRDNRAGIITGYRRLYVNHYIHIEPVADLRFLLDPATDDYKLRLGFGVPLNLQLFSGTDQNGDGEIDKFDVKLRSEDWDSWRDGFQIIRYIQYGRKEDNIYLNINRTESATIGHGTVTRWYIPNLDYFTTRVSAEFDGYSRYGGAELYTNDITRYNIVSTLFFLKPGSFFSDNWMAESFSLGFHYSADYDAPTWVSSNRQNDDGSYVYDGRDTHFMGGDFELKIVKWPMELPNVDVKIYGDFTKWLDGGSGITFGTLGRFNLYTKIRQAFRVRLAFRAYQDNYTPNYFDPFYEIMKYKWYSESKPPLDTVATVTRYPKLVEFSRRPDDWNHFGGYLEFSYALLDYVALTMALNRDSGGSNGDFLFHIEVPATKYFQIAATYYKVNWSSVKNIFDPTAENTMFIALARLRPVQILSFQFGIRKTPQPSTYYFPNVESIWDFKADLDLSWEF